MRRRLHIMIVILQKRICNEDYKTWLQTMVFVVATGTIRENQAKKYTLVSSK